MLEAIRQFFTYEEGLRNRRSTRLELPSRFRQPDIKEQYLAALEMLRAHLHRCLLQISAIAEIEIPKISDQMRYDQVWQLEAYEKLEMK
jgi:hypothetical protein